MALAERTSWPAGIDVISMPGITLAAPNGIGQVPANVSGSIGAITLSPPAASVSASVDASGAIGTIGLGPPEGSAVISITTGGSIGAITLSAPTGVAHADGAASGSLGSITLSAPTGSASAISATPPSVDVATLAYPTFSGDGFGSVTDAGTINFGATSFAHTPPSGFSAYDSTGATTFDPSNKGAGIALSNGNLTATASGATAWQTVRASTGKAGGKWYWEVTVNTLHASLSTAVGIASATMTTYSGDPPGFGGANFNAGVTWQTGQPGYLYNNSASGSAAGTYAQGDTLCFAVDLDANLFWARDGSGNWNNSGTANPATGTGGFNFTNFGYGPAAGQNAATLGGGTLTATCSLSTTGTEDIIVFVGLGEAAAGSPTVAVTASGITFTQRPGSYTVGPYLWEFYAANVGQLNAKTITATVTFGGNPSQAIVSMIALGVKNADLSSPFDGNASIPSVGGSGTSFTTNQSSDLLVACLINGISNTAPFVTGGTSGWTSSVAAGGQFGGAQATIGLSYIANQSAGTQAPTWTSITNGAIIDALQP